MTISFASDPNFSKGRLYIETDDDYRNKFERDKDRIIHSNAFRRLQYKTQVFINHEGDHFRNRLTHSIEVAGIARSIANYLGLSSDLSEAISLAHDLGHTPFGHVGEEALNLAMFNYGGFSHNAHAIKILTKLENKYASFKGLNLTWEVLEGIVKHNGPIISNLDNYIESYNKIHDLDLTRYSSAESQLASLADDISYISHDIEDSISAKLIDIEDIVEIDILAKYIEEIKNKHKNIKNTSLIYEVVRRFMKYLIYDLIENSSINLKKENIKTSEDIRNLNYQIIDFSNETNALIKKTKKLLFNKVYKHYKITSKVLRAQHIITELFKLYMNNIDLLPFAWKNLIHINDDKASIISDYIACMTDRFAISEYQNNCSTNITNL
jgi:dGTPase